jgi:Hypothetical glycosyl hydrolase family 15
MRPKVLIWMLAALAVSCTALPGPAPAAPTAVRFPATWTPAPTSTPAPPAATATLVIQSTPRVSSATGANIRRYPIPSYGIIGGWVDTTHLSVDALPSLAPRVQLALGPQVGAVRQLNRRVIDLARFDTTGRPEGVLPFARSLGSGYDGALLEHMGSEAGFAQFGSTDQILASVRIALGTRLLIADTYAWADGASLEEHGSDVEGLLSEVDGACVCQFLRAPDAPLATFRPDSEWKRDVDGLASLSSRPNLIVLVATRFDQVSDEEADQLQSWFDYALASFLMGENGSHAYFSFQGARADDYMASEELGVALGLPVGRYFPTYGVYARHFQHGLVVVNPGNTARELPLARVYVTPAGETLTRLMLVPHTGQILLMAD